MWGLLILRWDSLSNCVVIHSRNASTYLQRNKHTQKHTRTHLRRRMHIQVAGPMHFRVLRIVRTAWTSLSNPTHFVGKKKPLVFQIGVEEQKRWRWSYGGLLITTERLLRFTHAMRRGEQVGLMLSMNGSRFPRMGSESRLGGC